MSLYLLISFALTRNRTNGGQEENPFDDEQEDWDDYANDALVDNGEPGVAVRALYDYEGAEGDELTFKQGNLSMMIFSFIYSYFISHR